MNLLCALLIVLSTFSTIKEDPVDETRFEVLRYIPECGYEKISHLDFESAKSKQGYALYMDHYGDAIKKAYGLLPLPPSMIDKFESMTSAVCSRYEIVTGEELTDKERSSIVNPSKEGSEFRSEESVQFVDIEGNKVSYRQVLERETLYIFHFDMTDLSVCMEASELAGEISGLGICDTGEQLYSYVGGDRKRYFAVAMETGDLLISEKSKMVLKMLDAAYGMVPSILECDLEEDLKLIAPYLGVLWTITDARSVHRARIEAARLMGAPELYISELEDQIPLGQKLNVWGIVMDEGIKELWIRLFDDEEYAREEANSHAEVIESWEKHANLSSPEYKRVFETRMKNSSLRVEGKMVIYETVYDKQYIDATEKFLEYHQNNEEENKKK